MGSAPVLRLSTCSPGRAPQAVQSQPLLLGLTSLLNDLSAEAVMAILPLFIRALSDRLGAGVLLASYLLFAP